MAPEWKSLGKSVVMCREGMRGAPVEEVGRREVEVFDIEVAGERELFEDTGTGGAEDKLAEAVRREEGTVPTLLRRTRGPKRKRARSSGRV